MANRYMYPMASLEKATSFLFGKAQLTAVTGVVASFTGFGIETIARSGAGEYTITLQDSWNDILDLSFNLVGATAEDLNTQVLSYDAAAKEVIVQTLTAGVPTDCTNAFELMIGIVAKNSSAF